MNVLENGLYLFGTKGWLSQNDFKGCDILIYSHIQGLGDILDILVVCFGYVTPLMVVVFVLDVLLPLYWFFLDKYAFGHVLFHYGYFICYFTLDIMVISWYLLVFDSLVSFRYFLYSWWVDDLAFIYIYFFIFHVL